MSDYPTMAFMIKCCNAPSFWALSYKSLCRYVCGLAWFGKMETLKCLTPNTLQLEPLLWCWWACERVLVASLAWLHISSLLGHRQKSCVLLWSGSWGGIGLQSGENCAILPTITGSDSEILQIGGEFGITNSQKILSFNTIIVLELEPMLWFNHNVVHIWFKVQWTE